MIPYSFLDLAIVSEGKNIPQTLQDSVRTAQLAEHCGYTRYWFAEHHNMPSVASSATSVLIGHIASKTEKIRVGSGGIMLPNHSPLVIAEHFGTLGSLFPGRIDLGLGRAPGTDQTTAMALNPNFFENVRKFPESVMAIQKYLSKHNSTSQVRAIPGEGVEIPMWMLGSSTDSAYLASELGLPYAFASHFAPAQMIKAFNIYQNNCYQNDFTPYKLACVNVIIADTDEHAEFLATTLYQKFLGLIRNTRSYLPAPVANMDWLPQEEEYVKNMAACSFIGSKETVKAQLRTFIKQLDLQEIMATASIYDLDDKCKSMKYFADVMSELGQE